MAYDFSRMPAGDRLFRLKSLEQSDGWALFLARYAEKLRALEEEALNTETTPELTEVLKKARAYLTSDYTPAKILSSLLHATENEAKMDAQ